MSPAGPVLDCVLLSSCLDPSSTFLSKFQLTSVFSRAPEELFSLDKNFLLSFPAFPLTKSITSRSVSSFCCPHSFLVLMFVFLILGGFWFSSSPHARGRTPKSAWGVVPVSFCFRILVGRVCGRPSEGLWVGFSSSSPQRGPSWPRSSHFCQRCRLPNVRGSWWVLRVCWVAGPPLSPSSSSAGAPPCPLPPGPGAGLL